MLLIFYLFVSCFLLVFSYPLVCVCLCPTTPHLPDHPHLPSIKLISLYIYFFLQSPVPRLFCLSQCYSSLISRVVIVYRAFVNSSFLLRRRSPVPPACLSTIQPSASGQPSTTSPSINIYNKSPVNHTPVSVSAIESKVTSKWYNLYSLLFGEFFLLRIYTFTGL